MVVTLGEAMMVFNGAAQRPISVGGTLSATFAGAEANLAIGLARLGHAVRYLTVIGEDLFGRAIFKSLRGEGVDVSGVRFSSVGATGVMFKNRCGGDEPEVFYYRSASAFSRLGAGAFDAAMWREARILFVTGVTPALSAGCRALFKQVIADAAGQGIAVWLDPNYRAKLWSAEEFRQTLAEVLPQVDTLLPSMGEGELLTGKCDPGEMACKLMGMGAKNVVLKSASKAAAYSSEGMASAQGFTMSRVVDPIGAGDAFAAGYLSAFLDGLGLEERLRRGHAAAAMVCMTEGDWEGLPTRGELEEFIARRGEGRR